MNLQTAVSLLPTPTTAPMTGNGHARNLGKEVTLLPTPVANDDGKTPEQHLEMKARMGGGRKQITSLSVLARADFDQPLLPTPTVSRGRNATADRKEGAAHKSGTTLLDVAYLDTFGRYAAAVSRWAHLTRDAPEPLFERRLSADFVEWMMGFPIGFTAIDGARKTNRLKALGNAVVTVQATAAWTNLGGPTFTTNH